MAELAIHCADGLSLEGLIKLAIRNANCEDYLTCDNKNESLESLLKRAFSIGDDGTYALNVCGCGGGVEPVGGLTEVTYAELVALIGSSGLTPGGFYLLTDFATVHYMLDGNGQLLDINEDPIINTASGEQLILFAVDINKISSVAYSTSYGQDIIYYDWDPNNWLSDIAFSISGVIIPGYKGTIFYRHDRINDVSTGYDWRKVLYRRWKSTEVLSNQYVCVTSSGGPWCAIDPQIIYEDYLTFHCPSGETQFKTDIKSVHLEYYKDDETYQEWWPSILTNTVFILADDFGWTQYTQIKLGHGSTNNTFVTGCWQLVTRENFANNVVTGCSNLSFNGALVWDCYFRKVTQCQFGADIDGLRLGENTTGCIFENKVWFLFVPDKTINNGFRFVTVKSNVQGAGIGSEIDFSSATLVFTDYDKVIQNRLDGLAKLSYINNSDVWVISNATA